MGKLPIKWENGRAELALVRVNWFLATGALLKIWSPRTVSSALQVAFSK